MAAERGERRRRADVEGSTEVRTDGSTDAQADVDASSEAPPGAEGAEVGTDADGSAAMPPKRALGRLLLLAALIIGSVLIARTTGVAEELSTPRVRALMEGAGVVGFLIFLGVFAVGELVHVPGVFFVAAAIFAYGNTLGGLAAYVGAVVSVLVSFVVVRAVGGQVLEGIRRPFVRRMLAKLDERPVRVIVILRLVFWMAPPVNYALAMSSVRLRDYALGSAIGLLLPIAGASLFFDWVVSTFLGS